MKKLFLCLTTFAAVLAAPAATVAKAPIGDLGLDAQVVTNVTGLAEYDPMFSEWTNGAATLIGPIRLQQRPDLSQKDTVISTNGITVWRWIPDGNGGAWAQRSFDWWDVAKAQDLSAATNALGQTVGSLSEYVYGDILASLAGKAEGSTVEDILSGAKQVGRAAYAEYAMRADEASQIGNHDEAREAWQIFQQLDNAATKTALAAVSNEAQVVYRLFSSSNVVLEVTNYNSIANSPKLRLLQLTESNTYDVVWCETNNLQRAVDAAAAYTASATNALAQQAAATYAPRAWSRTTSGMGVEAPSNTTWISTPTMVIAGGYEPEKWVTSGGAIWLITSKGAMWNFSPNVTNTAFMNIAAQDGTPMFRIEKTDSYLLGVNADAVTVTNSTLYVHLDLIGANPPYVRVCTNLQNAVWYREEDGIPAGVAVATHAQDANGWTCTIENASGGSSLFAYFEYLQEGGTKIVNQAVMDVGQGIMCTDGIHKCRPVYNNGTITWEEAP